jgi:hypothetical protein
LDLTVILLSEKAGAGRLLKDDYTGLQPAPANANANANANPSAQKPRHLYVTPSRISTRQQTQPHDHHLHYS